METRLTPEFVEKVVAAQSALATATKNQTNTHFRYQYADHAAVSEVVMPAYNGAGLAVMQTTSQEENIVCCVTMITDGEGALVGGEVRIPVQGKSGSPTPQEYGAAITYARRYSLQVASGVAVGDDEHSIDQRPPRQAQRPAQAPVAKPPSDNPAGLPRKVSEDWTKFMAWIDEHDVALTDVARLIGEPASEDACRRFMKSHDFERWGVFCNWLTDEINAVAVDLMR